MQEIRRRDPHEPEFLQAVDEVLHTVNPVLAKHPQYLETMKRIVEPERMIIFRVPWVDDKGRVQVCCSVSAMLVERYHALS
jgi:glutamate dehydrogenase (NADP+)